MDTIKWSNYEIPLGDDPNQTLDLSEVPTKRPVNLKFASFPYPHLRDDTGTVLARDYADIEKVSAIVGSFDRIAQLERCIGFFASVIKSGEPWTATCQREYEAVFAKPLAAALAVGSD